MEDELMTIDETAKMLRRTPGQIRWLRHTGRGPRSANIAGRVYFRRSDVEEFINAAFEAEAAKQAG